MTYFDACYIGKFYLAEPDSAKVVAFAQSQPDISCLEIGKAEVVAVFHRKFREGIVDERGFHLLCDQFEADCASGLWRWHSIDEPLLREVARRFRALSSTTFLRAADGLHLTCAAQKGFAQVYTNDRHMIGAAPNFGLQVVTF